jgi:uncharacterized protein YdbL (DUF1318 family)
VAYSETTLGVFRAKVDRAVSRAGEKYLRLLATVMEDAKVAEIAMNINDEERTVVVTPAELRLRWKVNIAEGPNTPAKAEKLKTDLSQALPMLMQLQQVAVSPEAPPIMQVQTQRLFDEIVSRFALPKSITFAALKKDPEVQKLTEELAAAQAQAEQAIPVEELPVEEEAPVVEAPRAPTEPELDDAARRAREQDDDLARRMMED